MSDTLSTNLTRKNLAKKTYEMMRDKGERDFLTGLLNERGVVSEIAKISSVLIREQDFRNYNILEFDLIGLKGLNDKYSRSVANKFLVQAANELSKHFRRPTDIVGRIGGDEFIVVALNSEAGDLDKVIEEMNSSLPAEVKFNIVYKNFDNNEPIDYAVEYVADRMDRVKKMRPQDKTGRVVGEGVVVDLNKTNV